MVTATGVRSSPVPIEAGGTGDGATTAMERAWAQRCRDLSSRSEMATWASTEVTGTVDTRPGLLADLSDPDT